MKDWCTHNKIRQINASLRLGIQPNRLAYRIVSFCISIVLLYQLRMPSVDVLYRLHLLFISQSLGTVLVCPLFAGFSFSMLLEAWMRVQVHCIIPENHIQKPLSSYDAKHFRHTVSSYDSSYHIISGIYLKKKKLHRSQIHLIT